MEPFENLMYLFSSSVENRKIVRLNLQEAALLYKTAKKSTGNIVEIGRKYGGSALLLASAAADDQIVYSVDVADNTKVKGNFKLAPESVTKKIRLLKGLSKDVADKWTSPIGLIFIDGDHTYDGVALDIKKWCPFVVKGGYAIFHDVVGTGLGLDKLTNNLVEKKGWKFVESADTMVVLQREI